MKTYHYYIAEDIPDVTQRLMHEMNAYPDWGCAGTARGVKQAVVEISEQLPQLIFCDWDLVGGSGFEILRHVHSIQGYDPFVIFNTGFQSDHPEIAEELVNTYRPDTFIGKPYWQKLKEQLPMFTAKAIEKYNSNKPGISNIVWITEKNGGKQSIDTSNIVCVLQSPENPRDKVFQLIHGKQITAGNCTWQRITNILSERQIDHFTINKRYAVIVRKFVERYQRPHVYMHHLPHKIEVVQEYVKTFEKWLES